MEESFEGKESGPADSLPIQLLKSSSANDTEQVYEVIKQILPDLEKEITQDVSEKMEQHYQLQLTEMREQIKEDARIELEQVLQDIKAGMVDNFKAKQQQMQQRENDLVAQLDSQKEEIEGRLREQFNQQLDDVLQQFQKQMQLQNNDEHIQAAIKIKVEQQMLRKEKELRIKFRKELEEEKNSQLLYMENTYKAKLDQERQEVKQEKNEVGRLKSLENIRINKLKAERQQVLKQSKEQADQYQNTIKALQDKVAQLEEQLAAKQQDEQALLQSQVQSQLQFRDKSRSHLSPSQPHLAHFADEPQELHKQEGSPFQLNVFELHGPPSLLADLDQKKLDFQTRQKSKDNLDFFLSTSQEPQFIQPQSSIKSFVQPAPSLKDSPRSMHPHTSPVLPPPPKKPFDEKYKQIIQPTKPNASNYSSLVNKYMNKMTHKKTVNYNSTDLKEQRLFELKDTDDDKTRRMKQNRLDMKEQEEEYERLEDKYHQQSQYVATSLLDTLTLVPERDKQHLRHRLTKMLEMFSSQDYDQQKRLSALGQLVESADDPHQLGLLIDHFSRDAEDSPFNYPRLQSLMQERQQLKAIIFSHTTVNYEDNKGQFKMLGKVHQQLQAMLGEHQALRRVKKKGGQGGGVRWKGILVSDIIVVDQFEEDLLRLNHLKHSVMAKIQKKLQRTS